MTLSWALPAAAYVDRDEVETRGSWPACVRTVQFTGASDVEAPEFDAAAHGVGLRWTIDGVTRLSLSIPVNCAGADARRLAALGRRGAAFRRRS